MRQHPKLPRDCSRLLPPSFQPYPSTVIVGNGNPQIRKASGNQRLKELVHSHMKAYSIAHERADKASIVSEIMYAIRSECPEGAFVKFDGHNWYELNERGTRERITSFFRDALGHQYKSSTKSKIAKKREMKRQKQQHVSIENLSAPNPIQIESNNNIIDDHSDLELSLSFMSDWNIDDIFEEDDGDLSIVEPVNKSIFEDNKDGLSEQNGDQGLENRYSLDMLTAAYVDEADFLVQNCNDSCKSCSLEILATIFNSKDDFISLFSDDLRQCCA